MATKTPKHNGEPWTLPGLLTDPARVDEAAAVLAEYFELDEQGEPRFTGSRFERFAGGGDRADIKDQITPADLLSIGMLAVDAPPAAVLRILDRDGSGQHAAGGFATQISELLAQLPVDIDLVAATAGQLAVAEDLWTLIRSSGKGMGRTKTSKLLARKRPRLLPVIDSVVRATLGHRNGRTDFYETLQQTLAADDEALHNRLLEIRQRSGVGDDISVLRCFDILVWMSGARQETTRRAIEDAGTNLRD